MINLNIIFLMVVILICNTFVIVWSQDTSSILLNSEQERSKRSFTGWALLGESDDDDIQDNDTDDSDLVLNNLTNGESDHDDEDNLENNSFRDDIELVAENVDVPLNHQNVFKQYPIWRVHKYNGIDLKPIPVSLITPQQQPPLSVSSEQARVKLTKKNNIATTQSSVIKSLKPNSLIKLPSNPLTISKNIKISIGNDDRKESDKHIASNQSAKPQSTSNVENTNSSIPTDLIELAKRLGISDVSQLPSIEEAMSLLGTGTRDETIAAIRELASTDDGLELIRSFIDSNSEGAEELVEFALPDANYFDPLALPKINNENFQTESGIEEKRAPKTVDSNVHNRIVQYGLPSVKQNQSFMQVKTIQNLELPRPMPPIRFQSKPIHQVTLPKQYYGPPPTRIINKIPADKGRPILVQLKPRPTQKPKLTQSLISLSGVPLAVDRHQTNLEILRTIIPKENISPAVGLPSIASSLNDRIRGIPKLFPFKETSIPQLLQKSSVPISLPNLPQLQNPINNVALKNLPKVPAIPKIRIPSHFVLPPLVLPQNSGAYIRIKYPENGYNPIPQLPRINFHQNQPQHRTNSQHGLQVEHRSKTSLTGSKNNQQPPVVSSTVQPPTPSTNHPSLHQEDIIVADVPHEYENLPLDNYQAFKNAPRIVTSYGTPALPYTYPEDNFDNFPSAASNKKLTVVEPPPSQSLSKISSSLSPKLSPSPLLSSSNKMPNSKKFDKKLEYKNTKVSGSPKPQRATPFDFYATGKIHKANPEAALLLPLTVHQTNKMIARNSKNEHEAIDLNENSNDNINNVIKNIAALTNEGVKML